MDLVRWCASQQKPGLAGREEELGSLGFPLRSIRTDTSVLSLVLVASSTSEISMQRIYAPLIFFFFFFANERTNKNTSKEMCAY